MHGPPFGALVPEGGEGFGDLFIGECVTTTGEPFGKIEGCFRAAGSNNDFVAGVFKVEEVLVGEDASVGNQDNVIKLVTGFELAQDERDSAGFGVVAFEAANLERIPVLVNKKADHDLWVDTALFGEPDFAQFVFVFRFKM